MKEINEEIKLTIDLMQTVNDECVYSAMQKHLDGLLELKRTEPQRRLVECKLGYVVCDKPKPLSTEELKAGGWWCADTSEDALKAFISLGFKNDGGTPWDGSYYGCFIFESGSNLLDRGFEHHTSNLRQIHRIGNEFYWSEK